MRHFGRLIGLLAAAVGALFLPACQAADLPAVRVPVMLAESAGFSFDGDAIRMIEPGERVAFPIKLHEGYLIESVSGGAYYADGEIVLESARYPTTLVAHARPGQNYVFSLQNDKENGSVEFSHKGGLYFEGTEITVKATPAKGKTFLGFSIGKPLAAGGELVSRDPDYTFRLRGHTDLIANYAAENGVLLVYHAGGGRFSSTSADTLAVQIAESHYLCPNVQIADGTLSRIGHTLLGYTTDPEGKGRLLTPGANVVVPETGVVNLWPVWAAWTPDVQFTWTERADGIAITGWSGDEERLVIPETINGKPVKTLAAGAISGNFTTLVLPTGLNAIENGAITDCPKFTTLFFYDYVREITDRAFQNCPQFQTLHICAARRPCYPKSRSGTYSKKFERLLTAEGKKLIVVAGSSTVYGIDSPLLEELMGGEYAPVNYGTHAESSAAFYLEMISSFITEGDIVVQAPEAFGSQLGGNMFEINLWQMQECCFEVFSYVDIRNYEMVFTSFAQFNATRDKLPARDYEEYDTTVNDYGDYFIDKAGQDSSYVKVPGVVNFSLTYITDEGTARLNAIADKIRAAGGTIVRSFAPANRNAVIGIWREEAHQQAYVDRLDEKLNYPCITEFADMLLPGNYFHNSDYHVSTEGAKLRTRMLADDLKAYLAKAAG
ncbi:MAG: hypothetical protein IKD37_07350 [Clostridia bacterium]|nr:hypothetical protein [Clostridia bacterium]